MDTPDGFVITSLGATAWHCEAYGEKGHEVGAHCFIGDSLGVRCAKKEICAAYMKVERERLWRHIAAGAAKADPTMTYLLDQFEGPEELLHADYQGRNGKPRSER